MNENYISQLKAFQEHMNACFNVLMAYGDAAENDIFYQCDFEITFHGRRVKLANSADIFDAVERLIQDEITDCEENA